MSDERAEDRARAARIAAGDEAAFTEVIDALHRPLLRIAETYVGRGGGAEDLVQETWEAVAKHAAEFEGRSSLRTWVTRILMNRATTRRARDKRLVPLEEESDVAPSNFSALGFWANSAPEAADPEEAMLRRESLTWLLAALEDLPAAQKAVVTLRDVEEWSSEEVCNALELSESNQRVLLHRGRQRLQRAYESRLRGDGR